MTRPVKVLSRWERFKRRTVWHPINTDPSDDDRWTVRVWLPLYDLLVILAGGLAFYIGSALLNRMFPGYVVDGAAVTFAVAGTVTLLGVVFPALWRIEAAGKILIAFLLTSYAMLVLSYPSADGQNNSFITVILVMATWSIYPRLTRLFIRGYRYSLAKKAARA